MPLLSGRRPAPPAATSQLAQSAVCLWATVTVELPHVAHLADLVEVELRGDELVAVARCLRHDLPARITEIALAIELADAPRLLIADAIDRADEERVRHGVRRLLQLPEIFRQPRDR